jgi:hypothetical protein
MTLPTLDIQLGRRVFGLAAIGLESPAFFGTTLTLGGRSKLLAPSPHCEILVYVLAPLSCSVA